MFISGKYLALFIQISSMFYNTILTLLFALSLIFFQRSDRIDPKDGLQSLTKEGLMQHLTKLASNEFQGRRPFTKGEKITLDYLQNQFKEMGVDPGNGKSYLQTVSLMEVTTKADSVMLIENASTKLKLKGIEDYVLWTQRTDSIITWRDEDIVFAGFGIVAPQYNWNDYESIDVKGKIVIVLINDPGFGSGDSTFFKGNASTFYGNSNYKYEEAARQGAKGCLIMHNAIAASFPFSLVQSSWNAPRLYLDSRGKNQFFSEAAGWISKRATERIFEVAGLNFNELQSQARKRNFKAQLLNLKISTSMHVISTFKKSYNVIGKISGSRKPDEYILYTAHWDHLGIGRKDATGDSIYNGAVDNATGTASLLEIAKAFKNMKHKPRRTILFLSVTAEEHGLLGSAFYAENPLYPVEKTLANINMDCVNPWGKTKDIVIVGTKQSDVEECMIAEGKLLGRDVIMDRKPDKGFYFRSDQLSFAKVGIPAIYANMGSDFMGNAKADGQQLKTDYGKKYHMPSDEIDSVHMTFEGGLEDIKLLFQVGKRLSLEHKWPQWKLDSEFKAIRASYKISK